MNNFFCYILILSSVIFFSSCESSQSSESENEAAFNQAATNGVLFNEGLERCRRFVTGWLEQADSETGLIPRNLEESADIWNAKDAAADNYPFMVLTSALTDQPLFEGKMMDMLRTETELTSRWDALPDTYSFVKNAFITEQIDTADIMFGSSEYIKDGLLPLTEWLGASPWSERMISILDDMWKHAPIETPYRNIVSTNVEVNGEMLQTLARIYWMTGNQKYLDWAIRLGDYYLLNDHPPTQNFESLRLRDHGCEIVSGLCELYATVHYAEPEKKQSYKKPLHTMLDKILEVGRNEHGLFYNVVNPQTGEVLNEGIADNFGYTLNGFYTVYQLDSIEAYREATLKALNSLNEHYRNFDWENGSSDGYADAIEGALNLYNREPVASVAQWLDSETQVMWAMQQESGIIEGWHGDGNFARTTIMYCLWKSQGVTVAPWRSDIRLGAIRESNDLLISLTVDKDWEGKLVFDSPRHQTVMNLPTDWPRINQFPEWFTARKDYQYELTDINRDSPEVYTGEQLQNGILLNAELGEHQFSLKRIK